MRWLLASALPLLMLGRLAIARADDEPRSAKRIYELSDGALHVVATYRTPTGQWHYPETLTIDTGSGMPLTLRSRWTNEGAPVDPPLPLVEELHALTSHSWLLFGWSSWGGGLQRNYAWVVESTPSGPKIAHRWEYETSRLAAGFGFDVVAGCARIVIPRPPAHARGPEWALFLDGVRLRLGDLLALPYAPLPLARIPHLFTAPTEGREQRRFWGTRSAWFALGERGFEALSVEKAGPCAAP